MTKFSAKHYYWPTPKRWRKVGDALMGISGLSSVGSVIAYVNVDDPIVKKWLMIYSAIIVVSGIIGKFLSNFYKEEPPVLPPPTDQP